MITRQILYAIAFFVIIFSVSCQEKPHIAGNERQVASLKIDSTDPKGTYLKIKNLNPIIIDSFYTGLFYKLSDQNNYDQIHRHIFYYRQLAGQRKNAIALIAKAEGFAYSYFSKYDSSDYFFDEAIRLYKELNSPKDLAESYFGKACNYHFEGNYPEDFNYNYKALAIFEQIRDSDDVYKVTGEIAIAYRYQDEPQKAIATALLCLSYYQRHGDQYMTSYIESVLGNTYSAMGDYQKALDYEIPALALRRKIGTKSGIAESLNNIAAAYIGLKEWDKAAGYFSESLDLARQLKDERHIPIICANLAKCYRRLGNIKIAEQMLNEIIDTARQKGQKLIIAYSYQQLSDIHKEANDYKMALDYYEKYKEWNDSLYNYEKGKTINELNIKYETSKKEAEITKLNSEKKADSAQKLVYLLALFFTIIIAVLTILLLTDRNKKNKLLIEKAKLELAANARELTHFTESIINKNKFIEELESKLSSITDNAQQAIATEENNEQLSKLYQLKILTEDDWRQFKILFDKVHPGFINRLREHYPDLAPAEERQFLLIKLKIDNKECADMLGISTLSVKKNRYRLKKRFNLTEQDNLDEFVWGFV